MVPSQLIGIIAALTSALVWGSGDFTGGLATRRSSQFQVVTTAALVGLVLLALTALLLREPFPSSSDIAWSSAGGISGAVGIALLYRGLSTGSAAMVAPTSGVVAAIIPVIAGSLLEGLPDVTQLVGIPLGLAGIYLVSRPHPGSERASARWSEFVLALFAGVGFGGFFVLIAQVESERIFAPLAFAKLAAFVFGFLVLLAQRRNSRRRDSQGKSGPLLDFSPLALLTGVLDAGGNMFYLVAVQYVVLAVAGVISSMYPAATVILAVLVLGERIMRFQSVGVLLCLAAVALIAF
jgi:drug/metabolite transporter (DMT)-like permease